MKRLIVSLVFLGLLPLPAGAEVYQCKSATGETLFADKPCAVGQSEELARYDHGSKLRVSGQFTRNNRVMHIEDGAAYWMDDRKRIGVVLVTSKLDRIERDKLKAGDQSLLGEGRFEKYVQIEINLNNAEGDAARIGTMRTIVLGLNQDPMLPWTSDYGQRDIDLKVGTFRVESKGAFDLLRLASKESTPYIKWDFDVRLRMKN